MAFLNDMAIVHTRESFKEGGDLQRHLLKFYLRDPKQNWPIPATARQHWDAIYGPNTTDGRREEEWCVRYEEGRRIVGCQMAEVYGCGFRAQRARPCLTDCKETYGWSSTTG